jgi:hypothetical protein
MILSDKEVKRKDVSSRPDNTPEKWLIFAQSGWSDSSEWQLSYFSGDSSKAALTQPGISSARSNSTTTLGSRLQRVNELEEVRYLFGIRFAPIHPANQTLDKKQILWMKRSAISSNSWRFLATAGILGALFPTSPY